MTAERERPDLTTTVRAATIDRPAVRPGIVRALQIVAPLITLLVLAQAVLAGRGLFIDHGFIDIHDGIGMITFLLVAVQMVLAPLAGFRGRPRTILLGTSLLLLILVIVQLTLGFSGRDGGQAAAWHVPNGVVIFGLTVWNASFLARVGHDAGVI
jgi:hypothetical protein